MSFLPEISAPLIAIAVFGFTGSLHCTAMCGPLSAAACQNRTSGLRYHVSRIFAYGILGAIAGTVGHLIFRQGLESSGRTLAVLLGVIMTIYASIDLLRALYALKTGKANVPLSHALKNLFSTSQVNVSKMQWLSQYKTKVSESFQSFGLPLEVQMGVLTAILPCGFLYAALTQAVVVSNPLYSGLMMVVFAIATTPALFSGTLLAKLLQKFSPGVVGISMSVLLLLASISILERGLRKPHNHAAHDSQSGHQDHSMHNSEEDQDNDAHHEGHE